MHVHNVCICPVMSTFGPDIEEVTSLSKPGSVRVYEAFVKYSF